MFKHTDEEKKEAAKQAKGDIAVSSEVIVKDKMKGIKMEGGSKINPRETEDLYLVDDNLKKMSK